MNSETDGPRSLRDMEMAVEVEGREWMRRRLHSGQLSMDDVERVGVFIRDWLRQVGG
jgi:uncharacterized protein (DUF2384 family)